MSIYSRLLLFCETYLLCMFVYFIILGKKRKNRFNYQNSVDLNYIIKKHKLNVSKLEYKVFISIMNISNSFIISLTVTIMLSIKKYIYRLLVGFVIIIVLIIIIYGIIGKYFKKREE